MWRESQPYLPLEPPLNVANQREVGRTSTELLEKVQVGATTITYEKVLKETLTSFNGEIRAAS